jgi:pyrroline-5-carboxylate reductase
MRPDCLVISIAAGISTSYIERHLGEGRPWRVVRAMPNTPMLVGEGMAALAPGRHATTKDLTDARQLFESAGAVVEVTEDKLDAVTALSGSGPAYVFYLVEHMIRAGVELGLTSQQARQLAMRTALGASRMLVTSPDSPEELRRKVTSPGGTTQAAITRMEKAGVGAAVVDAIKAADKRSRELGL